MKIQNHDLYRPLRFCKDGDPVVIFVKAGNKKDIPEGMYYGIFRHSRIESVEEPRLNGAYTYWYGQKWGDYCIHAVPIILRDGENR